MSAFLDPAEVQRLTGRSRYAAQRRALDSLGIRYIRAATGEPLVREGDLDAGQAKARNRGPRWERIGEAPKPAT